MRRAHRFAPALIAALLVTSAAVAGGIPPRPEQLTFPPLTFDVPDPGAMRFVLDNGIPVYAKPDRLLPLTTVQVLFRGGAYMVPRGKEGLDTLAGEVWRTGGAGDRTAQQLDEDLAFLAANLSTQIGATTGSVRLNLLSKDLDEGLKILMDVLTRPRFQSDRFAKAKDDLIQEMKKRNDDSSIIERREWSRLIYGDDFWANHLATKASVDSITADDAKAFVASLIRAGNIVVAVSGDFDRAAMKAALGKALGTLPRGGAPVPPVPKIAHPAAPGVYVVNKPDVNQGRVSAGELGVSLGDPDEFSLRVGNDVLGGGGFTSWITKRVRSDEGLAYSAGSYFRFPAQYPGFFRAFFQSKSRTCPGALAITLQLIDKIRTEKVSADELKTAKASFIDTFPRRFESAERTAALYASDELTGIPHSYWKTYRNKVAAVSPDDILKAMRRHLHPKKMIILVVGNLDEILKGHPDYPAKLTDFGEI
ncbi:MAG TPA: insulinase family protein, partial [Acidobacteria bacterium]|nr:insulinase family protein [Acidobacteriota bacterium]